jgi:hypothetical protein
MMTVIAIMAGLVPILWSHGTGSEVMQRIAVPMIGGMVSSTVLTDAAHGSERARLDALMGSPNFVQRNSCCAA